MKNDRIEQKVKLHKTSTKTEVLVCHDNVRVYPP